MIKVVQSQGRATFTGALTRGTITRAFDKKYRKLVNSDAVILDFSDVSQVDTAGLAWVLLLIELASEKKCEISLSNMPTDFIKLATLSAVDGLLPIDSQ